MKLRLPPLVKKSFLGRRGYKDEDSSSVVEESSPAPSSTETAQEKEPSTPESPKAPPAENTSKPTSSKIYRTDDEVKRIAKQNEKLIWAGLNYFYKPEVIAHLTDEFLGKQKTPYQERIIGFLYPKYLQAIRDWDPSKGELSTLVFRYIRNAMTDIYRKVQTRNKKGKLQHLEPYNESLSDKTPVELEITSSEDKQALLEAINRLPAKWGDIIKSRYIDGRSWVDLGKEYRVRPEAIREQANRGLGKLRKDPKLLRQLGKSLLLKSIFLK